MSMKGDLPGLSNFCVGTMGSYQYSTLRSAAAPAWGTLLRPQRGARGAPLGQAPARGHADGDQRQATSDFFRKLFMVMWFP
jgi:hypothetical protein